MVVDTRGVNRYCFFVLEVQQAWVERAHEDPRTLHHRGMGAFMVAGPTIRLRSKCNSLRYSCDESHPFPDRVIRARRGRVRRANRLDATERRPALRNVLRELPHHADSLAR